MLPFIYACSVYRGMYWKLAVFSGIFLMIDAIYDCGMYMRFVVHGPAYLRRISELPPERSFGSIQTRLFVKYCAKLEIEKALGKTEKKHFSELCMVRSFKNQILDKIQWVKNQAIYSRNNWKRK